MELDQIKSVIQIFYLSKTCDIPKIMIVVQVELQIFCQKARHYAK